MRCGAMLLLYVLIFGSFGIARAQDQVAPAAEETVTVPKSEYDALKARLDAVEREVQELKEKLGQGPGQPPPAVEAPPEAAAPAAPAPEAQPPAAGGKQLALPDISLIGQVKARASSDTRDDLRNSVRLSELELGVQGYVYPDVKADAFITMSPEENSPAQVEEAYLTYLGPMKGLNFYVGEKHVAFGRTNILHNHSWLYVDQPLVLRNLVAEESLGGEGVGASYVLPTRGGMFAQLDLGTWTGPGPGQPTSLPNIMVGPGASFSNRFNTARLWTGYPVDDNTELEVGGSYATGGGQGVAIPGEGRVQLSGVDVSYRHFGEGTSRLLLRGEGVWRQEDNGLTSSTAHGYYLFSNWRPEKYKSVGLLYDWSEFPQAPDFHESALSLILTKQFSEQYYLRLQAKHGSRPGDSSYNELSLQWVWGVGPHTHNLE
ncbi:MAG: hypothetical protein ABSD48_06885 [Armatimonadota bacterium]